MGLGGLLQARTRQSYQVAKYDRFTAVLSNQALQLTHVKKETWQPPSRLVSSRFMIKILPQFATRALASRSLSSLGVFNSPSEGCSK